MSYFAKLAVFSCLSTIWMACQKPEVPTPSTPSAPSTPLAEAPSQPAPKSTPPERPAPLTTKTEATHPAADIAVNPSPDGQAHPGSILHIDQTDGDRTWTVQVDKVPQSVAWAEGANGTWVAVVKVVISGTSNQRSIVSYDASGNALKTLSQAAP